MSEEAMPTTQSAFDALMAEQETRRQRMWRNGFHSGVRHAIEAVRSTDLGQTAHRKVIKAIQTIAQKIQSSDGSGLPPQQ